MNVRGSAAAARERTDTGSPNGRRGCGVRRAVTQHRSMSGSPSPTETGGGTRHPSPSESACRPQRRRALRADGVIVRFAVARHGCVEIDEASNAVGRPLGDGRDHRSAVAVADQRDVVQVLVVQKAHDVGDMGVQADVGTKQMRALAKAGQRRRDHRMAASLKVRRDIAPAPASKPGAGYEEERSQARPIRVRCRTPGRAG